MRKACCSRLSSGKEAHIAQCVAVAGRCCQASDGEIKFPLNHLPCEIKELSSALKLLRAAMKERMRRKEIHPFGGAPELEQHDASPVKLEQIYPVGRMQRVKPHGKYPQNRVGFFSDPLSIIWPKASKIWTCQLSFNNP
jgi:hypothetical protein